MSRDKHPISVVPYPIERTPGGRRPTADESAEWDARWLRPIRVAARQSARTPETLVPAPEKEERLVQPIRVFRPRSVGADRKIETAPEQPQVSLTLRFLRWLFPEVNQRRAKRYPTPGLVAYYWTGGAPYSYNVGDMSATGLFLLTKERWAPGTVIQMTLQRQDGRSNRPENSICLLSEVVRWTENGAGFNFVLSDYDSPYEYGLSPEEVLDRKTVERFMQRIGVPHS